MFSYRDNLIAYTERVALGVADKDLSDADRTEVVHQLRAVLNYYAGWSMGKLRVCAYAKALQEKATREAGREHPIADHQVLTILSNNSGPEI
jgi:hypothetical protein